MRTSMVIHMPLGQDGTQPTHERTTTGVRRKRRTALPIDLTETEELGVDGVGQVVAQSCGASDGGGGTGQGLTVEREKAFPRRLATEGAGVRQGEIREMERLKERGFLRRIGGGTWREAVIMLRAQSHKGMAKLPRRQTAGLCLRPLP
jgi:hypothetical protein